MNPALSAFLSARLLDRAGGHRARVLARFRAKTEADWRSDGVSGQQAAMSDLLRHVSRQVPFYRERLANTSIEPETAGALISRLPVIERRHLQENREQFRAAGAEPVWTDATGGSTGTPLEFLVDLRTKQAREASLMWADSLAGWRPGERMAMLWGSDRDTRGALSSSRLHLRWLLDNRRWFNAFDASEVELARWHAELERFCPQLVVAYAGTLFLLARHLDERGEHPRYPQRGLVSSAEMITPTMRALVERVFPARVFDRYGNREFGAIAAECEHHQGLHVNVEDCMVEIDSPDPWRVPGPLLVTYLHNYAMPFIRYNTGDLAVWQSADTCPCGRRTPRLAPVQGRQSDTIRTADGRLIHGELFTHLFYGVAGVREFQFIQETLNDYTLLVVGDEARIEASAPIWCARIREETGAQSNIRVQRMERIPVLPSGKRRFTLSKVTSPSAEAR